MATGASAESLRADPFPMCSACSPRVVGPQAQEAVVADECGRAGGAHVEGAVVAGGHQQPVGGRNHLWVGRGVDYKGELRSAACRLRAQCCGPCSACKDAAASVHEAGGPERGP